MLKWSGLTLPRTCMTTCMYECVPHYRVPGIACYGCCCYIASTHYKTRHRLQLLRFKLISTLVRFFLYLFRPNKLKYNRNMLLKYNRRMLNLYHNKFLNEFAKNNQKMPFSRYSKMPIILYQTS